MKELRKITQEQLEEILHKHKLWLEGEEGGERADLSYVDLIDADLINADLEGADLTNTILQDTIISNDNKEYIKEEIKVLETNSMDFNKVFDALKCVIDNKNVNEIIITEDKIEIKINS